MDGSTELRQRRIHVAGPPELGPLAETIRRWTERLGHALVDPEEDPDLVVRSVDVEPAPAPPAWVAVSARRLDLEQQGLLRARGAVVLDGHQGLLDLAYAYAELLFGRRSDQRRHGLAHGKLEVGLLVEGASVGSGRLVGLNRCGAWILAADVRLSVGALVDVDVLVDARVGPARLPGRVVCDRGSHADDPRLLAIELAWDQGAELRSFRRLARVSLPA